MKSIDSAKAGRTSVPVLLLAAGSLALSACATVRNAEPGWLAGDHHIHSRFSYGWDREKSPPEPILGGDAIYPTPMNALMSRHFGLDWMVTTDHGGPNHSQLNLEQAYPELLRSRQVVPDLIQFYGMEFDTPGADHSSIIVPHTHDEAERLHSIESRFSRLELWPVDPTWNQESRMLEALRFMDAFPEKPLVIAHHPSRSIRADGEYALYDPAELRSWNDTAPDIAVGMEGAPGHQAAALAPDGSIRESPRARGYYSGTRTMGGFDRMTAIVGGLWDSMLGEGRDWWITANSDSHTHFTEGGADFWPGEYAKTYVWAEKTHEAILAGIRSGRVFVTTGDLVAALDVTASKGRASAMIGGTLRVKTGSDVEIRIRFLDPQKPNHNGDDPSVQRVDLIMGDITGPVTDHDSDHHDSARVVARFGVADWKRIGDYREIVYRLDDVRSDQYLRVRGTSSAALEPGPDEPGADPWQELWFYSNPIRIRTVKGK